MSPVASVTDKILRNTGFNTLGRGISALAQLFLLPYLVLHLGKEAYGVWAIVGALNGYFALADLGFGQAYVKYISEFEAQGDRDRISDILNTSFAFYSVVGIGLWFVFSALADRIVGVFVSDPALAEDAAFLIEVTIGILIVANATAAFGSVQQGLQRMDIWNKVGVFQEAINLLGTILVIEAGLGLRGLAINSAVVFGSVLLVRVWAAYRVAPWLRFRPWAPRKAMLDRFFRFGVKLQVERLAVLVIFRTDRLLVGWLLSLEYVTYYDLAGRITGILRTIPSILTSAIFPAVSELHTQGQVDLLRKIYLRSVKYLALATLPCAVILLTVTDSILGGYVGPGFGAATPIVAVLTFGYLSNVLSYPCTVYASGMGRPEWQMWAAIVGMALNLPLSIGLFYLSGGLPTAIAIGTVLSLFAANAMLIRSSTTYLNISASTYVRSGLLRPAAAGVAAFLAVYFVEGVLPTGNTRMIHLLLVLAQSSVCAFVFLLCVRMLGILDMEDHRLAGRVPFLQPIIGFLGVRS